MDGSCCIRGRGVLGGAVPITKGFTRKLAFSRADCNLLCISARSTWINQVQLLGIHIYGSSRVSFTRMRIQLLEKIQHARKDLFHHMTQQKSINAWDILFVGGKVPIHGLVHVIPVVVVHRSCAMFESRIPPLHIPIPRRWAGQTTCQVVPYCHLW